VKISSITVTDLIDRFVANPNGAEFRLTDVRVQVPSGQVTFQLVSVDDENNEVGVLSLEGWTVL
jgi:hypothetical protein